MNFAIWAAVSTTTQAGDDKDSLPEQVRKCRAAGLARGWVESVSPYIVPGESRTRYVNLRDAEDQIPPLRSMFEDAKAQRFHILILWDYNRLRDLLDPVAKTLSSYGVQLYSVSQPTEPLLPEDFNPYASDSESMMRGMSQIISRWQIADLRRKYQFGVRGRVESGLPSLKIPFGYIKPPGREQDNRAVPIQHPAHSLIILDIKNRFLAGMSIHDLALHLTRLYPTPSGVPAWSRSTIQKILRNPFYAGIVTFKRRLTVNDPRRNKTTLIPNPNPITHAGLHLPLYPYDDFLAIQIELERRAALPNMARYPWSGILSCAECGHRLRRKEKRYSCIHCHRVTIWDHELPNVIPAAVQTTLKAVAIQEEQQQPLPTLPDHNPQQEQLQRARHRIQQAYENEIYSIQEAEAKIKEIDNKLNSIQKSNSQIIRSQAEKKSFDLAIQDIQPLLGILPQWILQDDPRTVSALLHRLFLTIKITHDRRALPILRQ